MPEQRVTCVQREQNVRMSFSSFLSTSTSITGAHRSMVSFAPRSTFSPIAFHVELDEIDTIGHQ
jgi:hypothetical protein